MQISLKFMFPITHDFGTSCFMQKEFKVEHEYKTYESKYLRNIDIVNINFFVLVLRYQNGVAISVHIVFIIRII